MFHRASLVVRPGHTGYDLVGTDGYRRSGNKPNGTYIKDMSESHKDSAYDTDGSHPVSFLCKYINDQFLVRRFPLSHNSIYVNDGPNIVVDVLHLSCL